MKQIEGSVVNLQSTEVTATVIFCKLEPHLRKYAGFVRIK